jgi:pimeloyl-ACP methyl ester carboxylesterase
LAAWWKPTPWRLRRERCSLLRPASPATGGERERLGRLPDVQIEEWAGDGHFVHLVDPERFTARLRTLVGHCDQAG